MNGHNNLIPITKVKCTMQNHNQSLCNARDLHAFLGVGKMFAHWIQDRIQQHGFVENQDVVCLPILASKNQSAGRGGHNRMEYHLTIEAAKHISMAERTPKGKEARDYFIECERIVLEELRRTPDLPSLDERPICMYLPEDTEILCIGDDGLMKTGFQPNSWSNRSDPRLVIGLRTPRFIAMSNSQLEPPYPDAFGFPLWIEMRGREAFVWIPQKSPSDPNDRIHLQHAKTFIIGTPGETGRLIRERGYTVTQFLTRKNMGQGIYL